MSDDLPGGLLDIFWDMIEDGIFKRLKFMRGRAGCLIVLFSLIAIFMLIGFVYSFFI